MNYDNRNIFQENMLIIWQTFHVAPIITNKTVYMKRFDLLEHSNRKLLEFPFKLN